MSKYDYKYEKKSISPSVIEINFEVKSKSLDVAQDKAYKKLSKEVRVKGFRPGKAPKKMIIESLGAKLFEESVNVMLSDIAIETLQKESLQPIAPLKYELTKYAKGSDFEFKATVNILPEIDLEKVKKIKVQIKDNEVTDKEVEDVIQKMYENSKKQASTPETSESENSEKEGLIIEGADKRKESSKEKSAKKEKTDKPTDEWVKSLKRPDLKTIKDLKKVVKKEVEGQKEYAEERKYRYDVLEKVIELSEAEVPETTLKHEVEHRMEHFKEDLEKLQTTLEKYLEANKTTEEKLTKEWEKEIKNSLMTEIVLEQIARAAKIEISDDQVEEEIQKIKDKKQKKLYNTDQGRSSIKLQLRKFKTLNHLFGELINRPESQKSSKKKD